MAPFAFLTTKSNSFKGKKERKGGKKKRKENTFLSSLKSKVHRDRP